MESERTKMPIEQRAKIFLPFAGVRGLDEAIERKKEEKMMERKILLSEESEDEINRVLLSIRKGDRIKVTYYDGARYREEEGTLVKEDRNEGALLLDNESIIFFVDINRIEKIRK